MNQFTLKQGVVVRYDELTRRGLLRDETGQTRFFQQSDLLDAERVTAGQSVRFSVDATDTVRIRTQPEADPAAPGADEPVTYYEAKVHTPPPPPRMPPPAPAPVRQTGWKNWPGIVLSAVALYFLLTAGGEENSRLVKNPRLIGSVFGLVAALLLALQLNFFRLGAAIGRVRRVYWLIVLCSVLATTSQGCSGFEQDQSAEWYNYTLIILGLAVYLLPYQRADRA